MHIMDWIQDLGGGLVFEAQSQFLVTVFNISNISKGSSLSVACCCSPTIGESCRHMTSPGLRETGKCSLQLDRHVPATTLAREEGTNCGGELLHKEWMK